MTAVLQTTTPRRTGGPSRAVPGALVALSAIPLVAGTLRLLQLAAGTQAFTEGIGGALWGTGELRDDLAKGAGWVINLAIAEWAIGRPARRRHSS